MNIYTKIFADFSPSISHWIMVSYSKYIDTNQKHPVVYNWLIVNAACVELLFWQEGLLELGSPNMPELSLTRKELIQTEFI